MSFDEVLGVWEFTSSIFTPLVTAITNNLGVLLPVGLTVMGIMLGVSLIPRIIYKFF